MSKKDQSLESGNQDDNFVDDFSDDFSEDAQGDGSRMSREVKVGLAVIVLLVGVLGYVVYDRFSGADADESVAADPENPGDSPPETSGANSGPVNALSGVGDNSPGLGSTGGPSDLGWGGAPVSPPSEAPLPGVVSRFTSPDRSSSYGGYIPTSSTETPAGTAGATPGVAGTGTGLYDRQSSLYPTRTTAEMSETPATAAAVGGYGATAYTPSTLPETPASGYPLSSSAGQPAASTAGVSPMSAGPSNASMYAPYSAGGAASQGSLAGQGTTNPLRDASAPPAPAQPASRYASNSYSSSGVSDPYSPNSATQPAGSSGYATGQPNSNSGGYSTEASAPGYSSSSGVSGYSSPGAPGYSSSPGVSSYSQPSAYPSVAGTADTTWSNQPTTDDGTYKVMPGDTLSSISIKKYGTDTYSPALAEYNLTRVPNPDHLIPGLEIETPSAADLRDRYPELCRTIEHQEIIDQRNSAMRTASQSYGGRTYVVQEGDTLFDIAKFELGEAKRWTEIWQLNRNLLGDDWDYVSPGLKLTLPTEQSSSGTMTTRPPTAGAFRR